MLGVKITSHSSHSLLTDYQIVVSNLYLVSRGKLQPAQKKFNHLASDYETTLDNASTTQQCYEEDAAAIRQKQYNFRSIGEIEIMDTNSIIDVIGIVSLSVLLDR